MELITLQDLPALAKATIRRLPHDKVGASVVVLQGDLGAGKTTFVQALGKELGVQSTIQSPTYVLMKSYPTSHSRFKTLVHIDAYRLEKPEEFAALNPDHFLSNSNTLVCVEWPEKVTGILPTPDVLLRFSSVGARENERQIQLV